MKQYIERIILTSILAFFCIIPSYAQQFKWVKGGGTIQDFGSDPISTWEQTEFMCTDPNGNIYALSLVGNLPIYADTFYKSGAYGVYPNTLITSYTCDGVMRWAKLIASSGGECLPYGIVADSLGHVYVAGYFINGDLYIGYDTSIPIWTNQATDLIQFDTSGHFNWLDYVGDNTLSTEYGTVTFGSVLTMDGLNNVHFLNYMKTGVHITPTVTSLRGTYDLVYNSAGTLISETRLDLDSEWCLNGAVIDPSTNKLYVSGQIDQFIYGGFLTDTFYAAAFDASRNLIWMYFCGHGDDDGIQGVVLDNSKHLHFSGSAQSPTLTTVTFSYNGDSVMNTHYPLYDMSVILTTDTNGSPLWIKHYDNNIDVDYLNSITLLPNGKIAAAGTYAGLVTDGVASIVTPPGDGQGPFLVVVDSTGDLQTIKQINGDGFYNGANVITSDKVGNLYVGGYVEDSIWAGTPAIPAYQSIGGNTDFFIMKYGVNCSCTSMPTATFTDTGTHTVGAIYTGTTAGIDSIVWSFGDGHTATGTSVLHTYTVAGTFQLCVSVYTDCGHDSDCTNIVLPCVGPPVAAFTKTGMHTINVTYTGTTTALDSVLWIYGDGHTDTGLTATHTYTAIGIYHICAVAFNPCGNDTVCRYDTVLCVAAPLASFTDTGRHTIGGTYTGTTTGVDSIVWKFGDGTETTGTTVLHTFSAVGTYHVCVIAYSHCGNDTACNYDTVICVSAPVAAFTDTGRITIGTTYTGTTTAVDSVVWNFGDGTTSSGISSLHTYTATGIYHICVTAYSPCGSNTACKYDTVLCVALPTASFTDTGTHHTVGFNYTGSTAGLDSVVWSFGDGHSGTGIAPLHTYTASGTYFVCATIYTPCGIDSACDSVTVIVPTIVSTIQNYGNVKIYPNPFTDELNISGVEKNTQYRVLNISGNCLVRGTFMVSNNTIQMKQFVAGVYIFELVSESGEKSIIKLLKE